MLALQETTEDFVKKLNEAGIEHYLPYAQVSSSDGVFGNGLWSATPLADPTDDDVNSSASFMPGGTVDMGGQQIRFVSVHTTAPVPGYWRQWKRSLDELGLMREHTDTRYIFMGDFNATYDHTPFRDFLGDRFVDAARESGHGFTFSWPTNRAAVPMFAGIDHVVLDQGMKAGQCKVVKVEGSDHAALVGYRGGWVIPLNGTRNRGGCGRIGRASAKIGAFTQRPRADLDFLNIQGLHDLVGHHAAAHNLHRAFRRDAGKATRCSGATPPNEHRLPIES